MKSTLAFVVLFTATLLSPPLASANCTIRKSDGSVENPTHDPIYILLSKEAQCPKDVFEFKALLGAAGLGTQASMVANRGIHNPNLGSFSFFESVTGPLPGASIEIKNGEFFFGHFTGKASNQLIFDQAPDQGKLLIELIVWDYQKLIFNFYELRGLDSVQTRWFYRGNSLDILKDNQYLYRDAGGNPKFGTTLRCSACHTSGGPIMKELAYPHNDWWTSKRPLAFGVNELSPGVSELTQAIMPAEIFSEKVKIGMNLLETSPAYQNGRRALSLEEQLRPLFCENEINLESDLTPLESNTANIIIPAAFLKNPLLMGRQTITLPKFEYESLLLKAGMKFPETQAKDADHAWLTPVKGYSDLLAIESLLKNHVVTRNFAKAVLEVDSQNPLFSSTRCGLLKWVPNSAAGNWTTLFLANLQKSADPVALNLYQALSLNQPTTSKLSPRTGAIEPANVSALFQKLVSLRRAAFSSDISKNPKGQILEPGFRIIFPVPSVR